MTSKLKQIVACLVLVLVLSVALKAQAQTTPAISYSTLPNGVRLIVEPRHTVAIASIDVWVQAGTRMEKPSEIGAAHYLEHVIFTGTPTHPNDGDIDGAIEDLGGSLDAATSFDWAHFYTTVPSDSLKAAVAVVGDAVQHASLTAADVESERPIIESEIERTSDDPNAYASQQVRHQIFTDNTAYGRTITGTSEQVQALARDTIAGFYHRCYVPSATAVVIVGDTTVAQATAAVEAAFGTWTGPPAPDQLKRLPDSQLQSNRQFVNRDVSDATLVMGWKAPGVTDQPDAWVMDVLLTYLGQGGVDLLDNDLHLKKHLVKSISADYLTQRDPGLLTVTATLSPENVAAADTAVLKDIDQVINTPLTDSQLASAKQQLIASYLFDTETVSGTADSLGFYEMINTYQYDTGYIDHVNSVTSSQIQDVASRYLSPAYVETVITPDTNPESATISYNHKGQKIAHAPNSLILEAMRVKRDVKQARVD
jgi:zinc protease